MKIIAILLVYFSCAYGLPNIYTNDDLRIYKDNAYTYNLAMWCTESKDTSIMYADAVGRYCKKYGLRSDLIARQIFRESFYSFRLISRKGARGPCQITPFPEHDKLFRKAEKYNDTVPVLEQYHWIYPSVEVMCMIMRGLVDKYRSYDMALIGYWCGEYSVEMKGYISNTFDFQKTDYYKYVALEGYIEKYIMGL